jgi:hypothetical protein
MANLAMSASASWFTGPVELDVWMNLGTVSQLKAGPRQVLHGDAAAADDVDTAAATASSSGSAAQLLVILRHRCGGWVSLQIVLRAWLQAAVRERNRTLTRAKQQAAPHGR